jgi:hypothetical protein
MGTVVNFRAGGSLNSSCAQMMGWTTQHNIKMVRQRKLFIVLSEGNWGHQKAAAYQNNNLFASSWTGPDSIHRRTFPGVHLFSKRKGIPDAVEGPLPESIEL